ncbi:MAG: Lrp/AsnC family transcriptional regulator [Chloroflexi bacterium]|nr:Lrp/AsnC family transcriptional regulator [Chloroflexota bacterium]MCI0578931.1 Lrp/AsnC family transcriptional regulator [Chloroflexota bacterium]MCI0646868.1 Lrp/AsnC family transcriptional regulator [Chloroflexota bacterium]MCI0725861.1 Lrp/AsnC family transcriptional regulator [Chloroflexota bacterium]
MVTNKNLDQKDKALLQHLQSDARMTNTELARRVELSPPGLQRRLRKLEEMGVIEQYVTLVNREAVGFDMLCFVQVTLQRHEPRAIQEFKAMVQAMPEVLECHHITGEYDYLLKIVVRNRKHLEEFLVEKLTPVPGMDKIRTSLVLREIKTTTAVPLDPAVFSGDGYGPE